MNLGLRNAKFRRWLCVGFFGSFDASGERHPCGSASRQLANELDLQLRWTISPRTQFIGGYTYLWAGDYFDSPVIQGGPAGIAPNGATGGDGEFTYVQFSLRF
ncbi:hypothetical protein SAMN06265222_109111 [Neorhodopirellula lusitana]|uniref:Alginate export domain-containing protein n=2 Tax=Neorhodopirellula lusitana TaxID=445327 RepID=A0ABY1QBC3_9BACT|nr:hypothetical protein SAMN06265222_109111 [Neorhodopirellula lusitana]